MDLSTDGPGAGGGWRPLFFVLDRSAGCLSGGLIGLVRAGTESKGSRQLHGGCSCRRCGDFSPE
jgi:hypothetical protein